MSKEMAAEATAEPRSITGGFACCAWCVVHPCASRIISGVTVSTKIIQSSSSQCIVLNLG
jgi:hypothetical protein